MREALVLRDRILGCALCPLSTAHEGPVPWSGPDRVVAAVVGEAPGATESRTGVPFCGASGNMLRRELEKAGLVLEEMAFLNTVSCRPTTPADENRAPSPAERAACRTNLEDQLRLLQPRFVLLTGNVPMQTFQKRLRIGEAHGIPFCLYENDPDVIAYPIFHPAAVLRTPSLMGVWQQDLRDFAQLVQGGSWTEMVPMRCRRCGADLAEKMFIDRWGMARCEEHRDR